MSDIDFRDRVVSTISKMLIPAVLTISVTGIGWGIRNINAHSIILEQVLTKIEGLTEIVREHNGSVDVSLDKMAVSRGQIEREIAELRENIDIHKAQDEAREKMYDGLDRASRRASPK